MAEAATIREFQQALIEALGLKGHLVTRLVFTAEPVGPIRVEVEEILHEDLATPLRRVFELTSWRQTEGPANG